MDIGSGLTILGSAIGGGKVLEKILGPTSEYIGNQVKEWTEKKVTNISKILKNAEEKIGDKIDENGKVPPKILKGIIDDGGWCEDQMQIEYFGGVLASSRTGISRDDRGAYFISIVSRLSTYQLRSHYLFYHSIKQHFNNQNLNISTQTHRSKMEIFIPYPTYFKGLDFTDDELNNILNLLPHSIWGLHKEDLISDFLFGNEDHLRKRFPLVPEPGIIIQPSSLGIELFMWAYGYGQRPNNDFFSPQVIFKDSQDVEIGSTIPIKKK